MNYFNELQERIQERRLSEKLFYQIIKDIYATSIDYDPKDEKIYQKDKDNIMIISSEKNL